tara:strand:+ start:1805 stop:2233 length:429 start_codon:yes stop_codon:yes gene_type:complete
MSEPQMMDARQEKYLNWLLTPPHERIPSSQLKYCEENEIDPTTVRRWQKKAWFIKEWDRRVEELQGSPERTQRILDALYDKGVDGDVRAAKLYLEATHRLTPAPSSSKGSSKGMADLSDGELDELIGKMAEREKSQRQLKAI